MKRMTMTILMAAVLGALLPQAGKAASTNTSERAYVLTRSDVIDGVCYDSARRELTIFFHNGFAYAYSGVPQTLFRELVRADSAGSFFNSRVRGRFLSHRLSEEELVALVDRHDGHAAW